MRRRLDGYDGCSFMCLACLVSFSRCFFERGQVGGEKDEGSEGDINGVGGLIQEEGRRRREVDGVGNSR